MLYPEGTKVMVKPDVAQEMTKGGLHIPDIVRDKQQIAVTRGEIVAIGPLAEIYFTENNDFEGDTKRKAKVGDRCIFVKYGGASIRWDGIEYRILQDQDIVCYIDSDEQEVPDTRKSMM